MAGAAGEVRYEFMRPQQILGARARAPVAYIPIGPLEWHGPHLPYGVEFRVIVLVNGHGAPNQRATLGRIAAEASEPGRVAVMLVGALLDTRVRGHAELRETSYAGVPAGQP